MKSLGRYLHRLYTELYVAWHLDRWAGLWDKACNGLHPEMDYERWTSKVDALSESDRTAIRRDFEAMRPPPSFALLIIDTDDAVERTLSSLALQLYPIWRAYVMNGLVGGISPCEHLDERVQLITRGISFAEFANTVSADYVALLSAGDMLAEHALYLAAHCATRHHPDLIYADEDTLDDAGIRCSPCFKPDWDADLEASSHYIGRPAFFRRSLVAASSPTQSEPEWSLARSLSGPVHHLPFVLCHRRQRSAYSEHRQFPMPEPPPLVSIIIPTRNALPFLSRCVTSLTRLTRYASMELLIIDNRSDDPEALDWLAAQAESGTARILRYDAPFNFSAIINHAVAHAGGKVLCLLNNDTEITHPGWLEEMVALAMRPDVGAVGALLKHADGTIQHAGIVLGLGNGHVAGHLYAGAPPDEAGLCGLLRHPRQCTAVTAACMVLRKDVFLAAGGMDADALPIAFNDVDLCLKIRALGYRIVWTPHAEMIHHESASRSSDMRPDQIERFIAEARTMRQRWHPLVDPAYNPNLSLSHAHPSLARHPRVGKPWYQA